MHSIIPRTLICTCCSRINYFHYIPKPFNIKHCSGIKTNIYNNVKQHEILRNLHLHTTKNFVIKQDPKLVTTSNPRLYSTLSDTETNKETNNNEEENKKEEETEEVEETEEYNKLTREIYKIPGTGHRVWVIQPEVKWGPKRRDKMTSIGHLLAESVTLAETLPRWKVVEKTIMTVRNPHKKQLFGTGSIAKIKEQLEKRSDITAVFFSVDMLTGLQVAEIEKELNVVVYDRYTVVLNIFRDHAKSKEAQIQVALAELPYLRSRLIYLHGVGKSRQDGASRHIGGAGESFLELRKRLLHERHVKLKRVLERLKNQRQLLRENRVRKGFPVVAVVGYTNSGKTSLIKVLTGDEDIEPIDQLFATLDVTAHAGRLPSHNTCIYMDTVGFISDLPTDLIASFASTLEDAKQADLLIHVWDVSHPDAMYQRENVIRTLRSLNISESLLENMVEVANKTDLLGSEPAITYDNTVLPISCTKRTGLDSLCARIDKNLLETTGKTGKILRVKQGGSELGWLYRETAVQQAWADQEDNQYLLVEVVVDGPTYNKFTHRFGDLEVQVTES